MQDAQTDSVPDRLKHVDMTPRQRAELLDKVQWAQDFNWKQIEVLARYLTAYTAVKEQTIFSEGDRESYMAWVVAGRVRILKSSRSHGPQAISVLARGEAFGEMSLIDGEPRSATVVAQSDVILMMLTKERFFELQKEYPRIGAKLLLHLAQGMSRRLRMASGQLVEESDNAQNR